MPACSALPEGSVLDLTVNNHPGVMSHVCGLFARRAFNVEAILVLPLGNGSTSRVSLLVLEDERLPQVVSQLEKLEDVLDVHKRDDGNQLFRTLEADCN